MFFFFLLGLLGIRVVGFDSFFLDVTWNGENLQVLTNGIEVKLQRNALSVIEAPTGNEEDDDLEFENLQWNGIDMGGSCS